MSPQEKIFVAKAAVTLAIAFLLIPKWEWYRDYRRKL